MPQEWVDDKEIVEWKKADNFWREGAGGWALQAGDRGEGRERETAERERGTVEEAGEERENTTWKGSK